MSNDRKEIKTLKDYLKEFYNKYIARDYGEEAKVQREKMLKIDEIIEALEEHKKEQEVDTADTVNKINLLKKYRDREPPFNESASEEILTLVCYNNLGYCCGLTKTCVWRDSVLNLFQISPKDFVRYKNECHQKLTEGKIMYDKKENRNS